MSPTRSLSTVSIPRCLRRALEAAAVVVLAACGVSDPIGTTSNGSIRGTVSDNTGAAVANVSIELTGNAQAVRTTNSGANGAYTFGNVPTGTYALAITPPTGFTLGAAGTTSVTVAGGAQTSAPAFVLNRVTVASGSIRGTVTDHTGANVANARVALTGNEQPARGADTNANGVYTFVNVPTGTYTLTVTPPPGYAVGAAGTGSITVASGAQAHATGFVLNRMPPDSVFVAELRARLEADTRTDQFAGAVLVIRDGHTLFEGAYGLADRERAVPNTTLTQFRVGSMNKMLTAVAVLQLVQAGTVRLHAPLGTYLPDYPNAEMASKVTPHHLLTHTGGTGDIFGPQFMERRSELRTTDDYLQLYGTRSLRLEPGARWEYSNYGYILLGALIERVSGMSYEDYVAAHVLAPAGMTDTGSAPEDSVVPGRSVGYTRQLVPGALVSNAPLLPYRGTAAGGWYSTVVDFARFTGALKEHRLLDPAHTALLLGGKVPMDPAGIVKYAYGFLDRVQVGRRLVGHGGAYPGMSGELSFEPNGGYVVVVLSNLDPPAATMIEAFILGRLPN